MVWPRHGHSLSALGFESSLIVQWLCFSFNWCSQPIGVKCSTGWRHLNVMNRVRSNRVKLWIEVINPVVSSSWVMIGSHHVVGVSTAATGIGWAVGAMRGESQMAWRWPSRLVRDDRQHRDLNLW